MLRSAFKSTSMVTSVPPCRRPHGRKFNKHQYAIIKGVFIFPQGRSDSGRFVRARARRGDRLQERLPGGRAAEGAGRRGEPREARQVKTARVVEMPSGDRRRQRHARRLRPGHGRDQGRRAACRPSPSTSAAPCAASSSRASSPPTTSCAPSRRRPRSQARARFGLPRAGRRTGSIRGDGHRPSGARGAGRGEARPPPCGDALRGGAHRQGRVRRGRGQPEVADSRYQDALEEVQSRRSHRLRAAGGGGAGPAAVRHTAVYASFPGVVEQRRTSVGEFLAAGAPCSISSASIPCGSARKCRSATPAASVPGRPCASGRSAPREYTGRIARLSPTINERNRVLLVEADVPNDGSLRAGSFARAVIVTGQPWRPPPCPPAPSSPSPACRRSSPCRAARPSRRRSPPAAAPRMDGGALRRHVGDAVVLDPARRASPSAWWSRAES